MRLRKLEKEFKSKVKIKTDGPKALRVSLGKHDELILRFNWNDRQKTDAELLKEIDKAVTILSFKVCSDPVWYRFLRKWK